MLSTMRRYAYGFVNSQDFAVGREVIHPEYRLHSGPDTLVGRDDVYLPAVARQFNQFPHLVYSIHELITDGSRAGVVFTEHGRASKAPANAAAWLSIGIYHGDDDRLSACWIEQDYYGRRRQLETGVVDRVRPVAIDPWDGHDGTARERAEDMVNDWANGLVSWPPHGIELDPGQSAAEQPLIDLDSVVVDDLVAEGDKVVFHLTMKGIYRGGLGHDGVSSSVELSAACQGTLGDDDLADLLGVSGRVALQRQLRSNSPSAAEIGT